MSELLERLNETHKVCNAAYENWKDDRKNTDKREVLGTAVHELRKVASRLEIEMAVSEREEHSNKPIPIPNHRASKSRGPKNNDQGDNSAASPAPSKPKRAPRKKPAE